MLLITVAAVLFVSSRIRVTEFRRLRPVTFAPRPGVVVAVGHRGHPVAHALDSQSAAADYEPGRQGGHRNTEEGADPRQVERYAADLASGTRDHHHQPGDSLGDAEKRLWAEQRLEDVFEFVGEAFGEVSDLRQDVAGEFCSAHA
jgi:hypothetical protein